MSQTYRAANRAAILEAIQFLVFLLPAGWLLVSAAFGVLKKGAIAYAGGGAIFLVGLAMVGLVTTGRFWIPGFWPLMWLLWPIYLLSLFRITGWTPPAGA